jgi:hypothetical protein
MVQEAARVYLLHHPSQQLQLEEVEMVAEVMGQYHKMEFLDLHQILME